MRQRLENFKIIGISIESTNENGKSIDDMGSLWGRFYAEDISNKIPTRQSEDVYSIYTDYESNYMGKYRAIIGHKVESLDKIPEGLIGREFAGGKYLKFVAKGEMPDAIVDTWKNIWKEDENLNRRYTADFEVYGKASQNGKYSEVDVFIAVE